MLAENWLFGQGDRRDQEDDGRAEALSPLARIFLHAGFAKTGTTSLQWLLRENAGRLPPGYRNISNNDPRLRPVRRVARRLPERPGKRGLKVLRTRLAEFVAGIAPGPDETVLISTEAMAGGLPAAGGTEPLFWSAPLIAREIEAAFAGHALALFYSVRERESWLRSWHGHLRFNRQGTAPWERWSAEARQAGFAWDPILARIRSAVSCPVRVLPLEDDIGTRLGPGTAFLYASGLTEADLAGWTPGAHRNAGPSRKAQDRAQSWWFRRLPGRLRRAYRSRPTPPDHRAGA